MSLVEPHFSPQLLLRAQGAGLGLKAVLLDVDGVLTDGSLYFSEQGESFKAFSSLDGQGLKFLREAGIEPVVITGRDSPAVRRRVADLGIVHAAYGVHDKLAIAQPLLTKLNLSFAQVAAMGDDWPDLPLLMRAALAVAPPGAHGQVKAVAHHVTQAPGGAGAVRELCDLLMQANGRYAALLARYTTLVPGDGR